MTRFRDWINGLTRYPSRFHGDNLEDDVSVTTSGDAELERKMENEVERESQRLCNFSSKKTLSDIFSRKHARERRCDICSFDGSLLAEIFQNLGLVDQICLAVCCRILLTAYKGIIKDKATLPPQPTIHHLPLSFVNSDDKLRIQLLVRLEDFRWKYCAQCFLLKPRRMFSPDALAVSPLERRCSRYDGVMKLCPCLHFTRRDRNNVRILLLSSPTTTSTYYGCFGIYIEGWRCENHVCPFPANNDEQIQVSVAICNRHTGEMALNVWYSLPLPASSGHQFASTDPIFTCPHLNLLDLIYTTDNSTLCYLCGMCVRRETEPQEDTGRVTFIARHCLGYIDLSNDRRWRDHCHDPEGGAQYVALSLHANSNCHANCFKICIS